MSGHEQGPTWRDMAYQAAIDAAVARLTIDPDEYLEAMERNPGAIHLVAGADFEADCEICRKLRERDEPATQIVMPDGSQVTAWGPRGRR